MKADEVGLVGGKRLLLTLGFAGLRRDGGYTEEEFYTFSSFSAASLIPSYRWGDLPGTGAWGSRIGICGHFTVGKFWEDSFQFIWWFLV